MPLDAVPVLPLEERLSRVVVEAPRAEARSVVGVLPVPGVGRLGPHAEPTRRDEVAPRRPEVVGTVRVALGYDPARHVLEALDDLLPQARGLGGRPCSLFFRAPDGLERREPGSEPGIVDVGVEERSDVVGAVLAVVREVGRVLGVGPVEEGGEAGLGLLLLDVLAALVLAGIAGLVVLVLLVAVRLRGEGGRRRRGAALLRALLLEPPLPETAAHERLVVVPLGRVGLPHGSPGSAAAPRPAVGLGVVPSPSPSAAASVVLGVVVAAERPASVPPLVPPPAASPLASWDVRQLVRVLRVGAGPGPVPAPAPAAAAAAVERLDPAPPPAVVVVTVRIAGVRRTGAAVVAGRGRVRAAVGAGPDPAGAGDLAAELVDWHEGLEMRERVVNLPHSLSSSSLRLRLTLICLQLARYFAQGASTKSRGSPGLSQLSQLARLARRKGIESRPAWSRPRSIGKGTQAPPTALEILPPAADLTGFPVAQRKS